MGGRTIKSCKGMVAVQIRRVANFGHRDRSMRYRAHEGAPEITGKVLFLT